MEIISSITQLNLTNILHVRFFDISGNAVSNYTSPFERTSVYIDNLQPIQSVTTFDISGVSTVYGIDISGVIQLSTVRGIENSFIIKIDDIHSSLQTMIQKELNNKTILKSIDYELLKNNLYLWASTGYTDSYKAYKMVLIDPTIKNGRYVCSDGIDRDIWEYIQFILGSSIQDLINSYQSKLKGIALSYSVETNPISLILHVSRA